MNEIVKKTQTTTDIPDYIHNQIRNILNQNGITRIDISIDPEDISISYSISTRACKYE